MNKLYTEIKSICIIKRCEQALQAKPYSTSDECAIKCCFFFPKGEEFVNTTIPFCSDCWPDQANAYVSDSNPYPEQKNPFRLQSDFAGQLTTKAHHEKEQTLLKKVVLPTNLKFNGLIKSIR
ncbi:hypothetical protein PoB_007559500 [Plakobranchus ocellatus]|uniref:Uncharacterized protein n=1 Tax=Plakobranchus ocellatus TaxID=259542 RepID=A0AAV4DY17_9GAST|nr:hypothetical protein PoB_007559500 [Plakobranchus ocellatus]